MSVTPYLFYITLMILSRSKQSLNSMKTFVGVKILF